MPEDHKNMKKVQCWIPQDTWDKIISMGYNSPTIAVTKAFEKLLEYPREDPRINPSISPRDPLESPEIPVYKARIEGLEMVLQEKEKRIESLENDIRKADIDKEDLKNTYNNYFLQMQLLINQKAVSAPPGSARKEEKSTQGNRPAAGKEENTKEVTCLNCGKTFTAARSTRLYCSGACKTAYARKKEASG